MARPVRPLWLARPSRAAGMSPVRALAVLALVLLMIVGAFTALLPAGALVVGSGDVSSQTDLGLYQGVVGALRAEVPYYPATADALRAGDYPLRPFVTFRLPTLAVLLAALPDAVAISLLYVLAAGVAYCWVGRLSKALSRPLPIVGAMLLLAGGMLVFVQSDLRFFHEIWAGLLVALSLGVRRPGRWVEAAAIGAAAMLIRETSALYVLVMAALAWAEGDRREALGWLAGVAVLAIVLAFHAIAVAAIVGPLDPVSPGWSGMQGFGLFVRAASLSTVLQLLPLWLAAPLVALAMLGWAAWDDPAGLRVAANLSAYAAAIGLFSRSDTFYWALLAAPLLLVGLVFSGDGIRDLARALLDRPRIRVQRITR